MREGIRFEDWLEKQMADPEFRAEWERSAPGYQVAALRIRRGLTQEELAERVGTTQSSIARLERGKTEPRLSFLRKVVEALGGQLSIQITSGEEQPRRVEAAAGARTVVSPVAGIVFGPELRWQLTDLGAGAIEQALGIEGGYCFPEKPQQLPYRCFSDANAQIVPAVLQ